MYTQNTQKQCSERLLVALENAMPYYFNALLILNMSKKALPWASLIDFHTASSIFDLKPLNNRLN